MTGRSSPLTHAVSEAGLPLWRATNPRPADGERLTGLVDAEYAVIGAGVAGLSTALHLARAGRDVVVVDAVQAHLDGASASAGIIAPQLVRNTPADVLRKLGPQQGAALLRMIAEGGRHAFGLAAEHGIDCFAQARGFLAPIAGPAALARGERLIAEWKPFRDDLTLLDRETITALSGCRGYEAAVLDQSGGGLDPVALLLGLERTAGALGARLYRDSPMTRVAATAGGWQVSGPGGGGVRARRVLLCANGGNAALHPMLAGSVMPLPVYEVATEPLEAGMRRNILPGGHTMTDTSTDVLSLRFDRHGRLITALAAASRLEPSEIERAVNSRLERVVDAYRPVRLEYVWRGTAWINGTLLPRAVALGEGLAAVQACNGRGLAVNLIAGREMARWLAEPGYTPLLPLTRPRRLPAFAILRHIPSLLMTGSALVNRLTARPRPRRTPRV